MSDIFLRKMNELTENKGEETALVSSSEKTTWKELKEISSENSSIIKEIFSSTELVPLMFRNPFRFTLAVYSVWRSGKIPVPLNTGASNDEIITTLKLLETDKLISDFNIDAKGFNDNIKILDWNELGSIRVPYNNNKENKISEIAVVIFTSGSTGYPKGVQISFNNLNANINSIQKLIEITTKDSWLASLPFFHIGGFAIIWRALATGATLYLPEGFSTKDIINAVNDYKPAQISVVSTTLRKLIDDVHPYKELKAVFAGGGPVKGELMKVAVDKGFPVYKVYGSTETTSMVSVLTPQHFPEAPESAGKPLGGIEIKIANPDENGVGEVCVKGKQITAGYLNGGKNNLTGDEFLRTGDLGFMSNEGYLYITGRKSEFIISGGENINLQKVKNALMSLPLVEDAEAIGIPDEKWGEKLVAVVVTKESAGSAELKKSLKEILSKFEIPKEIKRVNKIPRTPLGKSKREELIILFR
jgi:O-succinylbenzoic acid--CoA ligase